MAHRQFSSVNESGSWEDGHHTKGKTERVAGTCKKSIMTTKPQDEVSHSESTKDNLNIISKRDLARDSLIPGQMV